MKGLPHSPASSTTRSALITALLMLLATCLVACGRGREDNQQADGAVSWSVSLENPTTDCVKPGGVLEPVITATRNNGSAVTDPGYSVSAEPADAVEQDAEGRLTIRGEGPLTLTFTYTGTQAGNSTITPQMFELMRDGTVPTIAILSPARGAMRLTASDDESVDISGSVHDALSDVKIVLVNEDIVVQDGAADTVEIASTQAADWGTNIVRVRAADACGNTADHVQTFIQSASYLAPTVTQDATARVPNASTIRVDQAGFDDNNRADFDDFVTLSERYLRASLSGLVNDVIATIPTQSVDGLSCTYSADPIAATTIAANSPSLELILQNGQALVTFDVRDVRIPVTYRQVCRGVFGGVISDISATFGHRIDSLVTAATVRPSVSARQLITSISSNTTVAGFSVDSATNPVLAAAVNAVLPFVGVEGQIENAIDSSLANIAEDLIETGLQQLTQVVPIVFPEPIDKTLNVAADWTSVGVNPVALTMELGHYVYPAAVGTPHATGLGAIHGRLASRALTGHPGAALTYAINDDAVNQMLWSLWYGGGLELADLQSYAAALPDLDLDLTGLSFDLSGLLPPVIMRSGDPSQAILSLPDVHVTGSIDLDLNDTLSGSGIIHFDVYASLLTDGRTGFDITRNTLNLLLGDIGSQFYLHVVSLSLDGNPVPAAEQSRTAVESYVRDVVEAAMRKLTVDIGEQVELPQFQIDFPAESFGPQSGFILDIVSLRRDDDRFVASVDADDAYAPPVVILDNWDELGAAAIDAARAAADGWLTGAELGCAIDGPIASGSAIRRNAGDVTNEIKEALVQAGAPDFVAREWNRVFKSAWLGWGNTLSVPNLAWFPSFAGNDFPSGIPQTSPATTGTIGTLSSPAEDGLTHAPLLQGLTFRLSDYLDQAGAPEAVDNFATDISSRFTTLLDTGTIDNVEGWAIYPDFAFYVIRVTAQIVLFAATQESDFLPTDLWPIPPPRGPLWLGTCLSGNFGNSSFQSP